MLARRPMEPKFSMHYSMWNEVGHRREQFSGPRSALDGRCREQALKSPILSSTKTLTGFYRHFDIGFCHTNYGEPPEKGTVGENMISW